MTYGQPPFELMKPRGDRMPEECGVIIKAGFFEPEKSGFFFCAGIMGKAA